MESNELAEIEASARAVVRRAYDLGRGEALRQVVDVLSADHPSSEQLALMAPEEKAASSQTASAEAASQKVTESTQNAGEPEKRPWWSWPAR